jgi:hypothetical protein
MDPKRRRATWREASNPSINTEVSEGHAPFLASTRDYVFEPVFAMRGDYDIWKA